MPSLSHCWSNWQQYCLLKDTFISCHVLCISVHFQNYSYSGHNGLRCLTLHTIAIAAKQSARRNLRENLLGTDTSPVVFPLLYSFLQQRQAWAPVLVTWVVALHKKSYRQTLITSSWEQRASTQKVRRRNRIFIDSMTLLIKHCLSNLWLYNGKGDTGWSKIDVKEYWQNAS